MTLFLPSQRLHVLMHKQSKASQSGFSPFPARKCLLWNCSKHSEANLVTVGALRKVFSLKVCGVKSKAKLIAKDLW